ncbi:sensor histidine kinase [Nonomuraea sp. NPDC059194]|uniref:sensor histidine kinase n=1 Tax=Nonomuraea sp. NPDC059194 TaxID=3346764 RepID=UPI0036BE195B
MPPLLSWLAAVTTAVLCPAVLLLLRSRARLTAELAAERSASAATVRRALFVQELHEVVAHRVSVMTLGIGAGRMTMGKDPDRAAGTLRDAEESGRQALAELQRMLAVLSAFTGVPPSRAPQPRLADLPDLLDEARVSGLRVDLVQDGSPAPVAPGVELSAFRIVQEALRVAEGASSATVTLKWRQGFLEVLVSADGPSRPAGQPVRERAALVGGTITIEGSAIHARLPLH